LLAEPIITTLFEGGRFTHHDSISTSHALQAYSFGLIAFCWARVLATACYAEKDSKTPMRYAAISVAVNILLALMLMWPLGFVGLALATTLASFVNVVLLLLHLRRRHGRILDADSFRRMLRAAFTCLPMLLFLFGLNMFWAFPEEGKILQYIWLSVAVIGSVGTFLLCAQMFGERLIPHRRP